MSAVIPQFFCVREIMALPIALPDKCILSVIHSWTQSGKTCWVTNDQFAEAFGLHPMSVSKIIGSLEKRGYISKQVDRLSGLKSPRKLQSLVPPLQASDSDPISVGLTPYKSETYTLQASDLDPISVGLSNILTNIKTNIKKRDATTTPQTVDLSEPKLQNPELNTGKKNGLGKPTPKKSKIELKNYGLSDDQRQAVERWIDFRRELKKPLTQTTLDAQIKRWGSDLPAVIAQSIENGWQGLFELKTGRTNQPSQDKAIQAYTRLSAAATRQDKGELNRLCEADPRIVKAIAAQGIKPKTWLLKHLQLDSDFARKADREAFVSAYNSVTEGN